MKFIVVLHTDDGQQYGVTVPDLPGCFSAGKGLDEALESVREAIDLHVETLMEDGADIPATGSLNAHQANPAYTGGIWAIVDVPIEKYFGPADKINKNAAEFRFVALAQLQMVQGHHQRHQVIRIMLQSPAGGKNR